MFNFKNGAFLLGLLTGIVLTALLGIFVIHARSGDSPHSDHHAGANCPSHTTAMRYADRDADEHGYGYTDRDADEHGYGYTDRDADEHGYGYADRDADEHGYSYADRDADEHGYGYADQRTDGRPYRCTRLRTYRFSLP